MEFYKVRKIQSTYEICILAGNVEDAARSIDFEFRFPHPSYVQFVIIAV